MVFLFLMILLHIVDDFVLQPVCLSKLKQKSFWDEYNKETGGLYKNDYKMALFIHGLSWSIMIHLPLFFMYLDHNEMIFDIFFCITILIWALFHSYVDNAKANEKKISLVNDQIIHFIQIIGLFIPYFLIYKVI